MIAQQFADPVVDNGQGIPADRHEIGSESLGKLGADGACVLIDKAFGQIDMFHTEGCKRRATVMAANAISARSRRCTTVSAGMVAKT